MHVSAPEARRDFRGETRRHRLHLGVCAAGAEPASEFRSVCRGALRPNSMPELPAMSPSVGFARQGWSSIVVATGEFAPAARPPSGCVRLARGGERSSCESPANAKLALAHFLSRRRAAAADSAG